MSYFHGRGPTIIGAGLFHCPVRDGKEWDQTAMVAKHKLSNRISRLSTLILVMNRIHQ